MDNELEIVSNNPVEITSLEPTAQTGFFGKAVPVIGGFAGGFAAGILAAYGIGKLIALRKAKKAEAKMEAVEEEPKKDE